MKLTPALLVGSGLANVALVVVLVTGWGRGTSGETRKPPPAADAGLGSARGCDHLCEKAKGDLDFLIEGLVKGKDPFYTPLAVRTLEHVLTHCLPFHEKAIHDVMPYLREQMVFLVAANATDEQKKVAHDEVLRILREFRARFDTGT